MPLHEESRVADRLSSAALVVALVPVVLLPQLVGGVHPHVTSAATVVELIALALLVAARWGRGGLAVSMLGLPLVVGLLFTLVQLAPMPLALRTVLSPVGTENLAFVTSLLPEAARSAVWPALSLDPPETSFAAVRLVGALVVFLVVADAARQRRGRQLVARVLVAGGALVFLVALGHAVLRIPEVWGSFGRYPGIFYAPLVNPNHLARILGGFGFLALARALAVRSRREALVLAVVGVACGAGVFLTLSRGGMVAFVGAAAVLGLLVVREKRVPSEQADVDASGLSRALVPALVLVTLGVGLWVGREAVIGEASTLQTTTVETSKAALYAPALSLLDDHGLTGIGNSAFGVASSKIADPSLLGGGNTYTHVENVVIETLVDHGWVAGTLLLLIAFVVGMRLALGLRDRAVFFPLPALAFLLFGDLFDFALEHAAGLFLAASLLGLAAGPLLEEGHTRLKIPRAAVVGVGLLLALVVALLAPRAVTGWRRGLDRTLEATTGAERVPLLHQALAMHPADAQYCYLLAVEARRARDPALALKWANRALVLWPSLPAAHVEAARALAARGRLDQAMIEYKAAWLGGKALLPEIVKRTQDVKLREAAVPDETGPRTMLCRTLVGEKRLDDAQACADALVTRPDAGEEQVRLSLEVALLRGDVPAAKSRLEKLVATSKLDGLTAVAAAKAVELVEGLDAARTRSATWVQGASTPGPLLMWRLEAANRARDVGEARELLGRLRGLARDAAGMDQLDRLEAQLLRASGEHGKLRVLLMRILERKPRDAGVIAELGLVELELDQSVQARILYERAARIDAENPKVKALARALKLDVK